jgi:HD-GYP domain-containing protein (c-di-GMP phosphodiesterase class II)
MVTMPETDRSPILRKIPSQWLRDGAVLPHNIYSRDGELRLRAGTRLSAEQLGAVHDSWVRDDAPPEALLRLQCPWSRSGRRSGVQLNVRSRFFASAERILMDLDETFAAILCRRERRQSERILEIASSVQMALAQDSEAFLAALELFEGAHYALLHAVHSATLCELVARSMGESESDRRRLQAAALTRDLGFLGLQEIFDRQNSKLNEQQKQQLHWHPRVSRRLLEEAGVEDELWLLAVEQHHERLDGSGYPEGALDEAIHPWARILGIADIYSAMTKERGYRDAVQGTSAIQEIFSRRGAEVDTGLTGRFVGVLGIFPPGTFVHLASGETAVVVRQGQSPRTPQIKAVANADGHFLPIAAVRDSTDPAFAIESILPKRGELVKRITHRQLWGDPEKIQLKSSFPL